jgi:hypothetical protein
MVSDFKRENTPCEREAVAKKQKQQFMEPPPVMVNV